VRPQMSRAHLWPIATTVLLSSDEKTWMVKREDTSINLCVYIYRIYLMCARAFFVSKQACAVFRDVYHSARPRFAGTFPTSVVTGRRSAFPHDWCRLSTGGCQGEVQLCIENVCCGCCRRQSSTHQYTYGHCERRGFAGENANNSRNIPWVIMDMTPTPLGMYMYSCAWPIFSAPCLHLRRLKRLLSCTFTLGTSIARSLLLSLSLVRSRSFFF